MINSHSTLMQLTGKAMTAVSATTGGTFTLVFEDGYQLMCLDDSAHYESYTMQVGDQEIIV